MQKQRELFEGLDAPLDRLPRKVYSLDIYSYRKEPYANLLNEMGEKREEKHVHQPGKQRHANQTSPQAQEQRDAT